jgi:purine-binding chemotaxis protein CheW
MNSAVLKPPAETLRLCTLRVGKEAFGIDSSVVCEVLGKALPHAVPRAPRFVAGVLAYRGEVLLAVSLRALLGEEDPDGASSAIVMTDSNSRETFALLVDGVSDVIEVDAEVWEPNPIALDERRKALFSGVYRMASRHIVRLESERLQPSRLAKIFDIEQGARR